jgi:hypothetical protein
MHFKTPLKKFIKMGASTMDDLQLESLISNTTVFDSY